MTPSNDARSVNSGPTDRISAEQCAAWRKCLRFHVRQKTIAAAADVSAQTVSNHVNGRCSHS